MFVMLDTLFQHVSGISVRCWIQCSNILTRFSVHGSCLFVRACYLIKETFFPYLADQATHIYAQNQLCFYSQRCNNILGNNRYDWKFRKMFLLLRTFLICLWFVFCISVGRSVVLWSPNRLNGSYCFSTKGRLQYLIEYSGLILKSLAFRVLSLCVSTLVSCWCKFSTVCLLWAFPVSLWYMLRTVCWVVTRCATPKLLSKVVVVCLKVTSSFVCLNLKITGVVIGCRIVRWDLRSRSS
jgi:hypothetical protein